jgi:transmembrane sensor
MNRQILEEAAAWFVEFNTGEGSPSARGEFDDWLRASPAHVQAYLTLVPTWEDSAGISSPEGCTAEELIAWSRSADNVRALQKATRAHDSTAAQESGLAASASWRWAGWRRTASLLVACIAAVGIVVGWYASRSATYTTQIGEQRSIALSDGSIVELNARSRVRVHFSASQRAVDLLDGQALFRVAKDAARPFLVHSDGVEVRAVGTEFDVHQHSSGTTVTVLEGRVAVRAGLGITGDPTNEAFAPADPAAKARPLVAAPGEMLLTVGEQLTIGAQVPLQPKRVDPGAVTAWRQRQLVFDKTSLQEVAEEFNRYNTRALTIEDPSLRKLVISGVFSSTDPSSLVRFLRVQPGIQITESNREIHITAHHSTTSADR